MAAGEVETMLVGVLRRISGHLSRGEKLAFLSVLAVAVVNSLLELVLVAVTAVFGSALLAPDRFFGRQRLVTLLEALGAPVQSQSDLLLGAGILALAAVTLRALTGLFKTGLDARYTGWCYRVLATKGFEALLRSPYAWHLERNSTTKVKALYEDLLQVQQLMTSALQLASDFLILMVLLVGLLMKNGVEVLAIFGLLALLGRLVHRSVAARLHTLAAEHHRYRERSFHILSQAFQGLKDIHVAGAHEAVEQQFNQVRLVSERLNARYEVYRAVPRYLMEVLGFAGLVAVAAALVNLGLSPENLAASLTMLGVSFIRILPTVNRIVIHLGLMQHSLPPAQEALDLIETARPIPAAQHSAERINVLELADVSYRYPGADAPSVQHVSLTVRLPQRIALVGHSGSGKTTLADLITGLLAPDGGQIRVNGEPLARGLVYDYPSRVGYVLQDPFLLEATVAENVALSFHGIDEERVRYCLRAAQLESIVEGLPGGLHAPIGERGERLSGGQAQRLAIARSLYQEPDLLVLDEATSALDTLTEGAFMATLDALRGRHTLIVIAHRLSTVVNCDQIHVLCDGHLLDSGTHIELMARCTYYQDLVRGQLTHEANSPSEGISCVRP